MSEVFGWVDGGIELSAEELVDAHRELKATIRGLDEEIGRSLPFSDELRALQKKQYACVVAQLCIQKILSDTFHFNNEEEALRIVDTPSKTS